MYTSGISDRILQNAWRPLRAKFVSPFCFWVLVFGFWFCYFVVFELFNWNKLKNSRDLLTYSLWVSIVSSVRSSNRIEVYSTFTQVIDSSSEWPLLLKRKKFPRVKKLYRIKINYFPVFPLFFVFVFCFFVFCLLIYYHNSIGMCKSRQGRSSSMKLFFF